MTTFVSYAREDYDVAQRLAADLRAAGLDVWIDQRNIRAGEKWDAAVEKALDQSPAMLMVLSPDAVESQAVMDEVSYALDEGKCVVPVLHRACRIPMRMRRLHYVDLTQSYDDGVERVVEALRNPQPGVPVAAKRRRSWQPPVIGAAIGLLTLMPVVLEAQRADPVYALAYESLLLVDVAAGSVVPVRPLPLPARVFIAFDDARQEMLYITGENGGQQLVALHIASRTVTAVPIQVTENLYAAQYDPLTDAIFGLTNAPGRPLVRIHRDGAADVVVATGAHHLVFERTASSYDGAGHRYFFIDDEFPSQELITIQTHPVVSLSSLPIPFQGGYGLVEFDPVTSHLLVGKIQGNTELVDLDPESGVQHSIATSPLRLFGPASYLDAAKRLLYLGTFPPDGFHLGVIDLLDGTVTSQEMSNGVSGIFAVQAVHVQKVPGLTTTGRIAAAIALAVCGLLAVRMRS